MSEQIYTNKVSIVHFHIFMSFYSIYAILLRIRFCRDLRFFCVNFWGQKLRLRKFFDKYDVWRGVRRHLCKRLSRFGVSNNKINGSDGYAMAMVNLVIPDIYQLSENQFQSKKLL